MSKFLDRSSNTISISEFYENHLLLKYDYSPPYQRKSVWDIEKKSFLIDSILKNFPMPPIFLQKHVDVKTGKTKFDVVDGKQRLTSIIEFIEGKITVPDYFGEDNFGPEELNGLKFDELDQFPEYKSRFWKYDIPIEYLDIENTGVDPGKVIQNIFDRLNRNGVPLNSQELRNAKFNRSKILEVIIYLCKLNFWKKRLKDLDDERMEDQQFISELLFQLIEDKVFDLSEKELDSLYDKWVQKFEEPKYRSSIEQSFQYVTDFMEKLELNFEEYSISGVSHLYGLWCFSRYCIENEIPAQSVKDKIQNMFKLLKNKKLESEAIKLYKESMSYRTKSKSQREKRINALIIYCGSKS